MSKFRLQFLLQFSFFEGGSHLFKKIKTISVKRRDEKTNCFFIWRAKNTRQSTKNLIKYENFAHYQVCFFCAIMHLSLAKNLVKYEN